MLISHTENVSYVIIPFIIDSFFSIPFFSGRTLIILRCQWMTKIMIELLITQYIFVDHGRSFIFLLELSGSLNNYLYMTHGFLLRQIISLFGGVGMGLDRGEGLGFLLVCVHGLVCLCAWVVEGTYIWKFAISFR